MMLLRSFVTALLASQVSARLVLDQPGMGTAADSSSVPIIQNFASSGSSLQKPLTASPEAPPAYQSDYIDKMPYKAGQHTLRLQDDSLCDNRGGTQWSGTADVSDEHRLFFYVFESRGDPSTDPVILWLNGGPGGSSLLGGFNEMGACSLNDDSNSTTFNEWGWNRNATVIILDQPAGVGFSTVKEGGYRAMKDADGSEDFQTFLNMWFNNIFPEKKHLPLIIAGESYGGHYVPTYVKHILDSRSYNSKDAFWGNITGVVLVDAVLDMAPCVTGGYELLCETENGKGIINETSCAYMQDMIAPCEEAQRTCLKSNSKEDCQSVLYSCFPIMAPYEELVAKGERSPYNIHQGCPTPESPEKCIAAGGQVNVYFNKPSVKQALGYSPEFVYSDVNMALNSDYNDINLAVFRTTVSHATAVLDAWKTKPIVPSQQTKHNLADIRMLVFNGNDDYVVNSPGVKRMYDQLPWSKQGEFRASKYKTLYGVPETTGEWKATRDGRLVVMTLDGSGHILPHDLPQGSVTILEKWMAGGWHF